MRTSSIYKKKIAWLLAVLLIILSGFATNYFWLDPNSIATENLRQRIRNADKVKLRSGWWGNDRTSESLIGTIEGKELAEFIGLLRVHHDQKVFSPAGVAWYTLEFYEKERLIAEVGYFPKLLVWYDEKSPGAAWGDGHYSSARKLNYWSEKKLEQMLAPYEERRKKLMR